MEKHWDRSPSGGKAKATSLPTLRAVGVEGNAVPIEPGAYYQVVEINVKDQKGYEDSGVGKVRDTMTADGGKVIGGGYNKAQRLVGDRPPIVI